MCICMCMRVLCKRAHTYSRACVHGDGLYDDCREYFVLVLRKGSSEEFYERNQRNRAQVESVSAGMVSHAQCPPSAAGSRQGAMRAVGYAAEATEAGRAAEGSGGERGAHYQAQQRRWYCALWERIQYNR